MFTRISAAVLITLAFGVGEVRADNWTRITTKDTFLEVVRGKRLSTDTGTARIRPNGRGSGTTANGDYKLTWVWDQGRYCRVFRFGDNPPSGTICALIDVDGNKIRFTNVNGNKSVSVWTIN